MGVLTKTDIGRQSPAAWLCLALLAGCAILLWMLDRRSAAQGTLLSVVGCLGLILPPRERMARLPRRLRLLSRRFDAAPILAALLSTPGYGLGWFYGANPYDEVVHLCSGLLAGAVLFGLLVSDGVPRGPGRRAWLGMLFGLALAVGWEVFEGVTGLIGSPLDTASDIVLTTLGAALGTAWAGPLVLRRLPGVTARRAA